MNFLVLFLLVFPSFLCNSLSVATQDQIQSVEVSLSCSIGLYLNKS